MEFPSLYHVPSTLEGRLLHLERFYNEYDEAADKSWRITNNLESLGVAQNLQNTPVSHRT